MYIISIIVCNVSSMGTSLAYKADDHGFKDIYSVLFIKINVHNND